MCYLQVLGVNLSIFFFSFSDMIQKLRRQSVKTSGVRGKMGVHNRAAYKSKSFIVPSPTPENQLGSPDDMKSDLTSATSASYESSPKSGPSR